jgi:hypothetical protein
MMLLFRVAFGGVFRADGEHKAVVNLGQIGEAE